MAVDSAGGYKSETQNQRRGLALRLLLSFKLALFSLCHRVSLCLFLCVCVSPNLFFYEVTRLVKLEPKHTTSFCR